MSGKKSSVAERHSSQVLDLYERAMKALAKKDYDKAREILSGIIENHPQERDVIERARAYLALCDRAREKKAPRPKTFEELLNYGVFLHNRGEFQEALRYLNQAAEIHPKNEHVLYCLAAAAARSGDSVLALKSLRGAINANAASRAQARSDSDFDAIRDDEEFLALIHSQNA